MRMMISYLSMFVGFLLVAACSKTDTVNSRRIDVLFHGAGLQTRSVGTDEDDILTLDVLVYRKDSGALECHEHVNGSTVNASVTVGVPVRYYVVANAVSDAFDNASSLEMFESTVWAMPSATDAFVMTGNGDMVFDGDSSVEVVLNRLMSRVSVGKVTPSFLGSGYPGSDIRLERVFLINVNGECPYKGEPAASGTWYNRMCRETAGDVVDGMIVSEDGRTVVGASSMQVDGILYCCPNPVDNDVDIRTEPQWSVRNTRLVIELSIDGVPNYYPITMPAMKCNYSYVIREAVLLGPGSASPDCPVDRTSVSFSVEVNPWGEDDDRIVEF